ncbi:transcription factor bHLH18-like [Abrus precatorius]|uniref:Transcription factor bHLH18-like n=1 Tax=Abrus precatorius TaxID=3816 RepID=A0A8B8K0G4_ABRPR|nr:transcription factor bHLH18-like [Abrus precatorius]
MDEPWENLLSYLEKGEWHDIDSLLEEFKGENSLYWKSQSFDSNFTRESISHHSNNMGNSSSLEENIGFDNTTSLKQHASLEKPLLSSSESYVLSFEDSTIVPNFPKKTCHHHKQESQEKHDNRKLKRCRSLSQTQHHILAERKRRENLTRMFIALSAIIPGLKKIDKASILNYTIDYVKYLEKRVKDLEEENKKKTESVICFKMKKSNVSAAPDGLDRPIKICPKVETRVSAKDVLIRVMCEKRKDIVPKLLAMLETYSLSIVCTTVLPFGNSTLNITSIAQMDQNFNTNIDNIVKVLTEDLLKCCNLQRV